MRKAGKDDDDDEVNDEGEKAKREGEVNFQLCYQPSFTKKRHFLPTENKTKTVTL